MNIHLEAKIRQNLEAGKQLTVLGVFNELKTFELRKFISNLRLKKGLPVKDKWETNELTKKRFKVYWMDRTAA